MANITEILGTDSLSATRLTLNSNFAAINDEIADITALIDPVTNSISGITSISANSINLSILSGGSTFQLVAIDSSGAVFSVAADFNADVDLQKRVLKSGKIGAGGSGNGSISTAPTIIEASTYFANNSFDLPIGSEGQEVTIVSTSSVAITVGAQVGASVAATSINLNGINSSVTVRFFSSNNTWYIVSSHAATIA